MNQQLKQQRRAKRISKSNGDRQYFQAVRKMRRKRIDDWQIKHATQKFTRRLTQLTYQAVKRQAKQTLRDNRRQYEIGAKVKVQGVRKHGVITDLRWHDEEFPIEVMFVGEGHDLYDVFPVEKVKVIR